MEFFFNEASLHGQFTEESTLISSIKNVYQLAQEAKKNLVPVYISEQCFLADEFNRQAIYHSSPNVRRLLLTWITKSGPFWTNEQLHSNNDYYILRNNSREEVATETGVAEATARKLDNTTEVGLLSLCTSDFNYNPISCSLRLDDGAEENTEIDNAWDSASLNIILSNITTYTSWIEFEKYVRSVCSSIVFSNNSFDSIKSVPYNPSLTRGLLKLLKTLNEISGSIDSTGQLNTKGKSLVQKHFKGIFSDSSDKEKRERVYKKSLTFKNPVNGESELFSWHGKTQLGSEPYRIHFEWPVKSGQKIPVVYIGPKLTKK